ncbi:MAG: iron ABC transporter substrate-binding protein [Caldilineaceae bacterium]
MLRRIALFSILALFVTACAPVAVEPSSNAADSSAAETGTVVVYSGRSENLVGPILERFSAETGIDVQVRYGGTAEMAATLLEEGANSPADIFFAQDPGGLGAVDNAGLLAPLPESITNQVMTEFRSPDSAWVGVSGRARVVVYNTDALTPADLPDDIWDFTDPQWAGRIGWAPTNSSFQAMVTAMRAMWGEQQARDWLLGIQANEPVVYEGNSPIVAAVGAGEIDVGFVNHYYLYRFLAEEGEGFPARNHFLGSGGPGSLVMVAGVGRLATGPNEANALALIEYLVSTDAQQYFVQETSEYPVIEGMAIPEKLPALSELNSAPISLTELADLQGTTQLLIDTGVLP